MVLKKGSKVKVEYEGSLDDGTVFDSSQKHNKLLEFEIGAKQVIPGFEKAVVSMKKGEEKKIKLKPAEAYGDVNPQLVKKLPRSQLPAEMELKKGMILGISLPNGAKIPALLAEVSDAEITLDLNHPLAGKNLNFKIKLVEVSN